MPLDSVTGADRAAVVKMVLRESAFLLALGIGLGAALAVAAGRAASALLFGLTAADPATLAQAVAALVVVSALATYVPADRAARIDPMRALRRGIAGLHQGMVDGMLRNMRTTIEISDSLFAKVKRTMQKRRTTLRALVEEGLAHVVADKPAPARLPRRAVFPGQPGLAAPHQPDDLPRLLQELRHSRTRNPLVEP